MAQWQEKPNTKKQLHSEEAHQESDTPIVHAGRTQTREGPTW